MESRLLLATIIVTNTDDAGAGSLRQAIVESNASSGVFDVIRFEIPGAGVQTIRPQSELPQILDPAFLDGWSQGGLGYAGAPLIELDGGDIAAYYGGPIGLRLTAGGTVVQGLVVHSFDWSGIVVGPGEGNVVQGCYVGSDSSGTTGRLGNIAIGSDGNLIGTDGDGLNDESERNLIINGIAISGSNNEIVGNLIGTNLTGTAALNQISIELAGIRVFSGGGNRINRNLISGNRGGGVTLEGDGFNVVTGNLIGTDVTGTYAIGNGNTVNNAAGVTIRSGTGNQIGTDGDGVNDVAERNIISGNIYDGVVLIGGGNLLAGNYIGTSGGGDLALGNGHSGVFVAYGGPGNRIERNVISANLSNGVQIGETFGGHVVVGNLIGTGADGTSALGNGQDGVSISGGDVDNRIGGVGPGEGNVIAFNSSRGVNVTGNATVRNAIRGNLIHTNGHGTLPDHVSQSINLGVDNITLNDALDIDEGPNQFQNNPEISTVEGGLATRVVGGLASASSSTYLLDFYASSATAFGGTGESRAYLGWASVVTLPDGTAAFDVSFPIASPVGTWISATATSADGNTSEFSFAVQVVNSSPEASAGGPYVISEGEALTLDASASSDPDGDVPTYSWDVNGDGVFGDASGVNPTLTAADLANLGINDGPNTYVVKVRVDDGFGFVDSEPSSLQVENVEPTTGPITAPLSPNPANATINVFADFSDPGVIDTHTATWDWGDGSFSAGVVTEANGSGSVTGSHAYSSAGVYTVKLTVTDNDGGVSDESVFQYVVVFDPSAGYVTGGGWITSPLGAYAADPSLEGRANFGFVAKYKNGSQIPEGQTQFQFQLANLNFHATSYDWLVVAGHKAQYKGHGTINGLGTYSFMLSAIDAGSTGGAGDAFRIKIWSDGSGGVIYDNKMGGADTDDPTTALGGGNIVIHKGSGSSGAVNAPDSAPTDLLPSNHVALVDKAIAALLPINSEPPSAAFAQATPRTVSSVESLPHPRILGWFSRNRRSMSRYRDSLTNRLSSR